MARKHIETIVCDRCGAEFDESPLHRASWFKPELVYMKALLFVGKNELLQSREHIPYDLCRKCADSLIEWFHNGKRKESQHEESV